MSRILDFFKFYFSAGTLHSVHSPYIFDFCKNVLDDKRFYYAFGGLEQLRKLLLKENQTLQVKDFGAGSAALPDRSRKVKDIAKNSATHPFFARLLFKIVNHYHPKTVLEMGTSLGMSTLYLAMPSQKTRVVSIEGCPETANWAKLNFNRMKVENVDLRIGPFEEKLPEVLKQTSELDIVFIDGNHRKEPTLDYFKKCLEKAGHGSIFIFDDIYWSPEMKQAWSEIKSHPSVSSSIDLFQFGLVFFNPDFKQKQHLKLVPLRWKPWRVY
ncbi:MAG: class I SAM-dependent methyltransferase [Saprospiraceae bacterium]